MKRILKLIFSAIVFCSISSLASAEPPTSNRAVDVALQAHGVLMGEIVNSEGIPQSGQAINVFHHGQRIATVASDVNGRFTVKGLKGGIFQLETKQGGTIVRAWSPGTAPPSAGSGTILVVDPQVVRSALPFPPPGPLRRAIVVGGIAGISGIIGGVIGYNMRDTGSSPTNAKSVPVAELAKSSGDFLLGRKSWRLPLRFFRDLVVEFARFPSRVIRTFFIGGGIIVFLS